MADFRARIKMLPREDGRMRPAVGPTWICRLRLDNEEFYASLSSPGSYFVADRTDLVYVTLLDTLARNRFEPGIAFGIVDDDQVATGVVEPSDGLSHPGDDTLAILQTWVRRRPEWFIRARLELNEHSAGWSGLIEDAFSTIDARVPDRATDLRVAQVKQKLGALVIYIRHRLPNEASEIIEDKLHDVHRRSLTICEFCALPGQRGSQSGYLCVRCGDCASENWSPIKP